MEAFVENFVAGSSKHKEEVVTELGADHIRNWNLNMFYIIYIYVVYTNIGYFEHTISF